MNKLPNIIVKRRPFDPAYYKWRIEVAIKSWGRNDREVIGIISNLVLRAYEQGVMDGKNDQDYYSDY